MPLESIEEEGLTKIPNLDVAQLKFKLQVLKPESANQKNMIVEEIIGLIKDQNMGPYYKHLCKELKWSEDNVFFKELTKTNEETLRELEAKIKDAEINQGESELREALLAKAEYFTRIGDKDRSVEAITKTMEKTVGLGNKMDLIFHKIRIGLFFMDHSLIKSSLDRANQLMEEGGDWDRRNRLKVYEGLYSMAVRDFDKAAELFLETVSTFTSYELMNYKQFVKYAVICSMISLDRRQLLEKVVKGAEISEVLFDCPQIQRYLTSFYNCNYADFFQCLAGVEQMAKQDRYLYPHYAFYVREMRIKAYTQQLEPYKSLTLKYMAEAFGVLEDFMEEELFRFIADGRLHCKIDKVSGLVVNNRPDTKNAQYQSVIKQGDNLLNRVQKLSREININ